jgi:hypothetical protein
MGWATFWAIFHKLNWGRCYDHIFCDFWQFSAEKIGVFLKNQCYDQIFE